MTQIITLEQVRSAARAAHAAGTLLATRYEMLRARDGIADPEGSICLYATNLDGVDCRCVIGSAMNEETIGRLDNTINGAKVMKLLGGADPLLSLPNDDALELDRLQTAHDLWLSAMGDCASEDTIATRKRAFFEMIDGAKQ